MLLFFFSLKARAAMWFTAETSELLTDFENWKDSVLERPHLSFTERENMKAGENVQKIAVKSGVHTENDRFFRIFELKKKQSLFFLIFLRLRLKVLIHHCFPKSRAWKLRLQLLKNRKACFTSPTWPIWALSLLILGYSKRARIQICRFDDYE